MTWWDSSGIVSLYRPEAHSLMAARWLRQCAGAIPFTPLHTLELMSALRLQVFRREIGEQGFQAASSAHRLDLAAGIFTLLPLPERTFQRAADIAFTQSAQLGARALDVLHVAAALEIGAAAFVTFDRRQAEVARAEGLRVLG